MLVVLAADHAGYKLKRTLLRAVARAGYQTLDLGTNSTRAVDYPDYAQALAHAVTSGRADRGILICGSGVGACIAANKLPGIRAAVCHDTYSARQGVEHSAMNVLVLGARVVGEELAKELVGAFLAAAFAGEERHCRRLAKIGDLEAGAHVGGRKRTDTEGPCGNPGIH